MTNTLTAEQALRALDYMLVACGPSPKMDDGTPCYDLIRKTLASLPSPPVLGERLLNALDAAISDRTKDRDAEIGTAKCVLNGVVIGLKEARDLFAENAKNSAPVSGEAVTQLLATALDGLMRLYDDVDEGDKTAPEFVAACAALRQFRGFSPLTNEPVGVTEPLTLKDFGYAPGKYMVTCTDCGESDFWLDKRATRCVKCAQARLSAAIGERG